MADAADARGKGKRKRAIELYRAVLAEAPDDHEALGKLAQLLAEGGDLVAASGCFRTAADGYHAAGFTDRGIGLLRQAVAHVPNDIEAWLRIVELYDAREKKRDAINALAEARSAFKKKADLPHAVRILDAHMALEPHSLPLVIDRALVAKQLGDAKLGMLLLLDRLATASPADRKKLRRALFTIKPSIGAWWRWVRNKPG
jgi:tetratricopeptide (TPR) repeat protein